MDRTLHIAAGSIVVGFAVLALKGLAWHLTGSAALYSDALESLVNVAGSALALLALRIASRPADHNHPYGHQKAELLAAVGEGALILLAAWSILVHAGATWRTPRLPAEAPLGLGLVLLATFLNLVWARLLTRAAARVRSEVLRADARHLMGDVVTSVALVLGVALTLATKEPRLDPILAAAAAVYVIWSGTRVIVSSISGLMDEAPDEETIRRIRAVVSANAEGALEAHDLRTRHAGALSFLQFHLVVPGAMSVAESHEICDRIEAALHREMAHLVVSIHVEPEGKAKHHGVLVL